MLFVVVVVYCNGAADDVSLTNVNKAPCEASYSYTRWPSASVKATDAPEVLNVVRL